MIDYKGIKLPDGEAHLQEWMEKVGHMREGKPTYQYHKYSAALNFCKNFRLAVDVGAHVGLWSRVMALDFAKVKGFEPMAEHAACWRVNMAHAAHASLTECALGEVEGIVRVQTRTPGSSGDTGVDPVAERSSLRAAVDEGGQEAAIFRLDKFELEDVDFMKIDCEGYEIFVLRGAEETLRRCKPCVIVEQKPETGGFKRYGIGVTDAVSFLEGLGAKVRAGIQGDYILSWD